MLGHNSNDHECDMLAGRKVMHLGFRTVQESVTDNKIRQLELPTRLMELLYIMHNSSMSTNISVRMRWPNTIGSSRILAILSTDTPLVGPVGGASSVAHTQGRATDNVPPGPWGSP